MKLSAWAKLNSLQYKSAHRLFQRGLVPGARQLPSGTIVVDEEKPARKEHTVVYARVSSSENKSNLDAQADRVSAFCAAKGWVVRDVIKECASGLNDQRPKLLALLTSGEPTRIVVEHKDRLTRFGFEYIRSLFTGEIVIVNEVVEDESDLMQDFVSLVTSFCARLYGRRRSRRRTEALIKELSEQND
jgi:putative resolvase